MNGKASKVRRRDEPADRVQEPTRLVEVLDQDEMPAVGTEGSAWHAHVNQPVR